jgi:hypothetical protein
MGSLYITKKIIICMETHIDSSHPHLVAKQKLFNQPKF